MILDTGRPRFGKHKRKPVGFTLSPECIKNLKLAAKLFDTSQSLIVESALEGYIKRKRDYYTESRKQQEKGSGASE